MAEFTPPDDVADRWAYDREYRAHKAAADIEHAALCADLRARRQLSDPPTPDPERTLDALRRAAGLRTDVRPAQRTVSDERAEAKGQRVSAARRAQARGDTP